eukprot:4550268-Amphidinium_carterae.1
MSELWTAFSGSTEGTCHQNVRDEQLFNLTNDTFETVNLALDASYQRELSTWRNRATLSGAAVSPEATASHCTFCVVLYAHEAS